VNLGCRRIAQLIGLIFDLENNQVIARAPAAATTKRRLGPAIRDFSSLEGQSAHCYYNRGRQLSLAISLTVIRINAQRDCSPKEITHETLYE